MSQNTTPIMPIEDEDNTNYGDWTRAEINEYNKLNPMAIIECPACDDIYKVLTLDAAIFGDDDDDSYFDSLDEAMEFCDAHNDLGYGLIILCDKDRNEIGQYGDFE